MNKLLKIIGIIIINIFIFHPLFSNEKFLCYSTNFKEISIKSTEHKKMYDARKKLITKIKNNMEIYDSKMTSIYKKLQKGSEPFSFAEYSDNYGLNKKYYAIEKDLKFNNPIDGESIFIDESKNNYTKPEYKIISYILKQTFNSTSGNLKIYFLKSDENNMYSIFDRLKNERPNIKVSAYVWSHKKDRIDDIFLKHDKYVTLPIKFQTDVESTYRLDARPPSVILQRGFEGTNFFLPNKIFGDNTVFSAKDENGAKFFYREVVKAFRDNKDPQFGGKKLYLYKINSKDFPAVELRKATQQLGLDEFSFQMSSRDYIINSDTDQLVNFDAYIRAKKYLSLTARFNKEVQLAGPIPAHKIEFIREMPEIN